MTINLDLSELRAFVDNNFNVAQMEWFFFDKIENMVGKGENAGYQHFLLFLQCFQKANTTRADNTSMLLILDRILGEPHSSVSI